MACSGGVRELGLAPAPLLDAAVRRGYFLHIIIINKFFFEGVYIIIIYEYSVYSKHSLY